MQLRILLFAAIRDAADADSVDIAMQDSPSASDIIDAVADRFPKVAGLIRVSRLAVDGQYVGNEYVVEKPEAEFALIPPVSGG